MRLSLIVTLFFLLILPGWAAPNMEGGLSFHDMLVHQATASAGRTALHTDPIEFEIIHGRWTPPVDGVDGWEGAAPRKDWGYEHDWLEGGWASWQIESPREQVMILEAKGHSLVYVNGEIHMGDPYSTGYVMLPVLMREGLNEFLFLCGRGSVYPKLTAPPAPVFINDRDISLPDYDPNDPNEWYHIGVPIVNATTQAITIEQDISMTSLYADMDGSGIYKPIDLAPLSVRKFSYQLITNEKGDMPTRLVVSTFEGLQKLATAPKETPPRFLTDAVLHAIPLTIGQRETGKAYKDSYISKVDGSAQYYAVVPKDPASNSEENALILSLHGASVEAIGQAQAYGAQDWATIVCPTNRRPYGFDWEDWGRLDALSVVSCERTDIGSKSLVYLTGHSMGGHGTWYLGATGNAGPWDPYVNWRAIGPSAGWESFFTYADKPRPTFDDPLREMIERASNQSDTALLLNNLVQLPTYILHGDADDNVPVEQARGMVEKLKALGHPALELHEEPGQGHWWDLDQVKPGADCVDWAPMWDFMRRQPERDPLITDITVVNPAIGPQGDVTIEQQMVPMLPSRIVGRWNEARTEWVGTAENVAAVSFRTHKLEFEPLTVVINGQLHALSMRPFRWVQLVGPETNRNIDYPEPSKKSRQTGPFKQAFNHRFSLVYGTQGTPEEDAATLARARYDLEQWWVRGNGDSPLIADVDFDREKGNGHSVILYGNADTNAVWDDLLADCPIQVRNGEVQVGLHTTMSGGIGGLFLWPRKESYALVGVVTGTDITGLRLTERMRYFTAGVHYPDYMFLATDNLHSESEGIVDAGYFSNSWEIE